MTGVKRRGGREVSAGSDTWHVDPLSEAEQLLAGLRSELQAPEITDRGDG